jgi:hypothetical protein
MRTGTGRADGADRLLVAAAFLVLSLGVLAGPRLAMAAQPGDVAAVWVQKEVRFVYTGFTTKYSCDGLEDKMRRILLQLGARDDLKVMPYGCLRSGTPETNPGVRIVLHVLQPVGAAGGEPVAAHWKTVDLLAGRDAVDASLDCELIAQLKRDVLPLFSPRQVDYGAVCSAFQPITGGTQLKAQVLIRDAGAAVASR